jgi:hypothetical protein
MSFSGNLTVSRGLAMTPEALSATPTVFDPRSRPIAVLKGPP